MKAALPKSNWSTDFPVTVHFEAYICEVCGVRFTARLGTFNASSGPVSPLCPDCMSRPLLEVIELAPGAQRVEAGE